MMAFVAQDNWTVNVRPQQGESVLVVFPHSAVAEPIAKKQLTLLILFFAYCIF
jgi:hypothetical protein